MKKRFSFKSGMGLTLIAVIVLAFILAYPRIGLEAKKRGLLEEKTRCEQRKEELQSEEETIEEYREYVKSDEYIEDVARDKLGLVQPGDVVFEPESEQ